MSQQPDPASLRQRLIDALVPPIASSTTLALLGQPLLRAVVNDRAYMSQGVPRNLVVRDRTENSAAGFFARVVARLAAELALSGLNVMCASVQTLGRELQRYALAGDVEGRISPVLGHTGYLFVFDIDFNGTEMVRDNVLDYIATVMASGRGVIFCTSVQEDQVEEVYSGAFMPYYRSMTPYDAIPGGRNV